MRYDNEWLCARRPKKLSTLSPRHWRISESWKYIFFLFYSRTGWESPKAINTAEHVPHVTYVYRRRVHVSYFGGVSDRAEKIVQFYSCNRRVRFTTFFLYRTNRWIIAPLSRLSFRKYAKEKSVNSFASRIKIHFFGRSFPFSCVCLNSFSSVKFFAFFIRVCFYSRS